MKNFDTVLKNISPHYHQDFMKVSKSFQDFEEIQLACNVSSFTKNICYPIGGDLYTLQIGYLIVSSYRLIWHFFLSADNWRGLFGGHDAKRPRMLVNSPTAPRNLDMWVIDAPTFPITGKEQYSNVQELTLDLITGIDREDFKVKKSDRLILVENFYSSSDQQEYKFAFLKYSDGETVYNLIQKKLGSPKKNEHPTTINIADQLEKLAELNKYQTITDEEYEIAKKRLLGIK
jgi:hypothetical protein